MKDKNKNKQVPQCVQTFVMFIAFKRFFRRLFVLAIFPILFLIGSIAMILELPFWLFTGKGILNSVCYAMLLEVLNFLED
jgi:hypothetical protein